jgi:hypothetical protein
MKFSISERDGYAQLQFSMLRVTCVRAWRNRHHRSPLNSADRPPRLLLAEPLTPGQAIKVVRQRALTVTRTSASGYVAYYRQWLNTADCVEEVGFSAKREWGVVAMRGDTGAHPGVAGCGIGISLASLRKFWAVAARRNSSLAPFGPLRRRRSSFRMRLRWAKSISIFFRSRREMR